MAFSLISTMFTRTRFDEGSDAERVPTFGGLSAIINTWDPKQLRAASDFDLRHQINSNWVYDLPFGRGKHFGHDWNRAVDTFFGGWELVGIYRWTSGFPFSVSAGSTYNTNFQLSGNTVQVQNVKQGLTYVGNQPYGFNISGADPSQYWTGETGAAGALRLPYPGESGERNNFRGQGFFGVDAGLNKTFSITERQSLRFSAFAYNLTTRCGSMPPRSRSTVRYESNFIGLYSGTLTKPRVMEFALRYSF